MLFWIREIIGWALVALSMVLARIALLYISNRQVVEGAVVVFLLLAMLRGGILLIRISTAARIAARDVARSQAS